MVCIILIMMKTFPIFGVPISYPKVLIISTWLGELPEYSELWMRGIRHNPIDCFEISFFLEHQDAFSFSKPRFFEALNGTRQHDSSVVQPPSTPTMR